MFGGAKLISVLKFLEGETADIHGRTISDIWAFNDSQIETEHNFIQWLFPTSTPSISVPGSPILSAGDIKEIRESEIAIDNLHKSGDWYFNFLERNTFWIKPHDHNHLRITRVIQSIRLLSDADDAEFFKQQILRLIGNNLSIIPHKTQKFWKDA